PSGLRARARRRPHREIRWQGAGARAGGKGVRLAARSGSGRMTDVDRYLAAFKAFAGNGAGRAPSWLKEIREGAIARFAELGFPTTKKEEWRFTSVAPIVDPRFSHPESRIPHPGLSEIGALLMGDGPRVVLVDGRYAPELSSAAG